MSTHPAPTSAGDAVKPLTPDAGELAARLAALEAHSAANARAVREVLEAVCAARDSRGLIASSTRGIAQNIASVAQSAGAATRGAADTQGAARTLAAMAAALRALVERFKY